MTENLNLHVISGLSYPICAILKDGWGTHWLFYGLSTHTHNRNHRPRLPEQDGCQTAVFVLRLRCQGVIILMAINTLIQFSFVSFAQGKKAHKEMEPVWHGCEKASRRQLAAAWLDESPQLKFSRCSFQERTKRRFLWKETRKRMLLPPWQQTNTTQN